MAGPNATRHLTLNKKNKAQHILTYPSTLRGYYARIVKACEDALWHIVWRRQIAF